MYGSNTDYKYENSGIYIYEIQLQHVTVKTEILDTAQKLMLRKRNPITYQRLIWLHLLAELGNRITYSGGPKTKSLFQETKSIPSIYMHDIKSHELASTTGNQT